MITIETNVYKSREPEHVAQPWLIDSFAIDPEGDDNLPARHGQAATWMEALELAYQYRDEIDTELMDEIHEERASRRHHITVINTPSSEERKA